jgi:hypothetical protein
MVIRWSQTKHTLFCHPQNSPGKSLRSQEQSFDELRLVPEVISETQEVRLGETLVISFQQGGSLNGGTPIAGWFKMGNPVYKWMIWGYPHDLGNLHTAFGT